MEWDFPKAERDPWYQWAYDQKYGVGAFARDFSGGKKDELKMS